MDTANKTYNITTNTTTILEGQYQLVALLIGKKGASSNTATIYDSDETTGANVEQKKATLDTTDRVGRIEYNIPMYKGIYIVTQTGTAPDITVVYRDL